MLCISFRRLLSTFHTASSRLIGAAAAVSLLAPGLSTGDELAEAVVKQREMIVTANPLASAAGAKILKNGGTAADAMVAAQAVLGLVEPQSSGLGGGAFAVYYDAASKTLTTFDGREKAPAAATDDRFLDDDGNSIGFVNAWQSGLSVGVPGTPRIMEMVHDRYGRKPWPRLLQPAISMAQKGFELTERTSDQVAGLLARNVSCEERLFFRDPVAFDYFVDTNGEECSAKPAGTLMRNKAYANTLKAIRNGGADAFYHGQIAQAIADAVNGDRLTTENEMTIEDLAAYEVIERAPVCIDYRGYDVCGMGPPSSGALAVGQILGILENYDLGDDPLAVEVVHLFTQAGRLAFADRGLYVGDTDFVTVPVEGMLDKNYLRDERASLIGFNDMGSALPGDPPGVFDPTAPDPTAKTSGTSHISIVDRFGNALSMTTTIESSFGNGVMVHGFLLNNELTDFSFAFEDGDGVPIANRVQPGKRPRSSMSPTIVLDGDSELELVSGSPGGSRIIGYTAQSVINHIDFGLDPQESINTPHYQNRNGSTELEAPIPGITIDYDRDGLVEELKNRDHPIGSTTALTSGLSIIHVDGNRLIGGADKRRDGTVDGR